MKKTLKKKTKKVLMVYKLKKNRTKELNLK